MKNKKVILCGIFAVLVILSISAITDTQAAPSKTAYGNDCLLCSEESCDQYIVSAVDAFSNENYADAINYLLEYIQCIIELVTS